MLLGIAHHLKINRACTKNSLVNFCQLSSFGSYVVQFLSTSMKHGLCVVGNKVRAGLSRSSNNSKRGILGADAGFVFYCISQSSEIVTGRKSNT